MTSFADLMRGSRGARLALDLAAIAWFDDRELSEEIRDALITYCVKKGMTQNEAELAVNQARDMKVALSLDAIEKRGT